MTVPYTCIRCGYATNEKYRMNDHFFKKKKICQAIKNDIELTLEVKNKILLDRVYRITKPKIKLVGFPTTAPIENEKHYIYLLQPKEYASKNENVYKIDRTVVKGSGTISRLNAYGKNANIITLCQCINSLVLEKKILDEFNSKFSRHEFGNEYFVGEISEMTETIYLALIDEKNNITVNLTSNIINENNKIN